MPHFSLYISLEGEREASPAKEPTRDVGEFSQTAHLGRAVATAESIYRHRARVARSAAGRAPSLLAAGDVSLTNRASLLAELDLPRAPATDLDLAMQAYLRWGDQCVRHLRGEFAFAIWNQSSETVFAARDPLGIRRLYLLRTGSLLGLSSSSLTLAAHIPGRPSVDPIALLEWVMYRPGFHGGTTFFQGVQEVRAGEAVQLDSHGRVERARFWNPLEPRELEPMPAPEAHERAAELIRGAVERRCGGDRRVASYCSAGLDSTAVTYFQAQATRRSGTHTPVLVTFSCRGEFAHLDESKIAASLARDLGAEQLCIPAEDAWTMDGVFDPGPALDTPLRVLQAQDAHIGALLRSQDIDTVLTGQGGDLLFGEASPVSTFLGRVLRGAVPRALGGLAREACRRPRSLLGAGRRLLQALAPGTQAFAPTPPQRPTPSWVAPGALAELERLCPAPSAPRPAPLTDRREIAERFGWQGLQPFRQYIEYTDSLSEQTGVEVVHPLFDVDLVEFILRLDPGHHQEGGGSKGLIRGAMRPHLPAAIVDRPKTQDYTPYFVMSMRRQLPTMVDLLKESRLADLGLISADELLAEVEAYCAGEGVCHYPDWHYAILAEAWLRGLETYQT